MGLSPQEREQGYGLTCMAKPTSELLEIEWDTDDAQPKLFPPRENVWFTVVDRIARTEKIIELCLAAGPGLAPILSLTAAALRRGYRAPVTLLFSAQTREDLMLDGLFAHWQSQYRNFDYRYTLTREQNEDLSVRIPQILATQFPSLQQHSVCIAASPTFVLDCSADAMRLGAQENHIHSEGFFDQFVPESPPRERLLAQA